MATGKITKRAVEAIPLPSEGKREHLWDDTLKGFGVMVTPNGSRSYLIQYRIGGRGNPTRRVTIGKHGSPWTAETARNYAAELLEKVRRKVDPFDAERQRLLEQKQSASAAEARIKAEAELGFSTIADRFLELYAKVKQRRTWRETEGIIRRDLKPHFGDRPIPHITDLEIVELIDAVHERGDSAALKAYRVLRSLFGWAKEKRQISSNPMQDMKPPATATKRERVLSDDELRLVWQAAGGLGWPFGPLVRLLVLTGQRLREVAEIPWPELDVVNAQWMLPGGNRTKNGLPNLVPLSDAAMAIIKELPRIKSAKQLVFTTTGTTPVSGFSKIKARLDHMILDARRREAATAGEDPASVQMDGWRFHDLRRTLASGCQRLGVKIEVTEAILNHVSGSRGGIVGVYQTYKYEAEKRDALAAWGRHVEAVVHGKQQGSNVVQLAPARA